MGRRLEKAVGVVNLLVLKMGRERGFHVFEQTIVVSNNKLLAAFQIDEGWTLGEAGKGLGRGRRGF